MLPWLVLFSLLLLSDHPLLLLPQGNLLFTGANNFAPIDSFHKIALKITKYHYFSKYLRTKNKEETNITFPAKYHTCATVFNGIMV